MNPELISATELQDWLGYDTDGDVRKWYNRNGVPVWNGKNGKPVTLRTALVKALVDDEEDNQALTVQL